MNKEWSNIHQQVQIQLRRKDDFEKGLDSLFLLRKVLLEQINSFYTSLSKEQFCAIPFISEKGYHNKTIAYSLYHIFRIEDIVSHSLIQNNEEVFFTNGCQQKMGSPIITTGNELIGQEIADFSKRLDICGLYNYIYAVNESTNSLLTHLKFTDLKTKFDNKSKQRLHGLKVVDPSKNAVWLIDYWCGKDIGGLIKMPFSRHWIMHVEAALRIREKLLK